jgi:hypothetical protein
MAKLAGILASPEAFREECCRPFPPPLKATGVKCGKERYLQELAPSTDLGWLKAGRKISCTKAVRRDCADA